jgi:hypothetical protein
MNLKKKTIKNSIKNQYKKGHLRHVNLDGLRHVSEKKT